MKIRNSVFKVVLSSLLGLQTLASAAQPVATTDDMITDDVRLKLAGDEIVKGGALVVNVRDGAVILSGDVRSAKQRDRAARVAKKVRGVKSVDNEIRVVKSP